MRGMRKRWEGLGGCFAILPKSVLRCFDFAQQPVLMRCDRWRSRHGSDSVPPDIATRRQFEVPAFAGMTGGWKLAVGCAQRLYITKRQVKESIWSFLKIVGWQFLLDVAFGIGDDGPRAEVVFEDVDAICDACGHALRCFDAAKLGGGEQIVKGIWK